MAYLPNPLTRRELFYAAVADFISVGDLPDPTTREEEYLKYIAENITGGSGGVINTYTKEEIDNKISVLMQEIDWKETVDSFADLAIAYPDAEEGWTASVLDTDKVYRYNGTEWVDIYTLPPLATENNDGLMSAGQVKRLDKAASADDVYTKKEADGSFVAKETGKGLSANDYTTAEKEKLAGLENYDDTEIKEDIAGLADTQILQGAAIETLEYDTIVTKTVSGDIITVDDAAALPPEQLKVRIEPVRDLHGYDRPWAGGMGKNLLPMTVDGLKTANTLGTWRGNTYTLNGVDFIPQTDDNDNVVNILINGTSEAADVGTVFYLFSAMKSKECQYGNMLLSGGVNENVSLLIEKSSSPWTRFAKSSENGDVVISSEISTLGDANISAFIRVETGYTAANLVVEPMIRRAAETDDTYEPYTNICSIEGRTECRVEHDLLPNKGETKHIAFPSSAGTVFGGEADIINGKLTVTHGEIASYNGEELPGEWISDSSAYPGKNLLKIPRNSITSHGVTMTVNKDTNGNVINVAMKGTATEYTVFYLTDELVLSPGTYIISGKKGVYAYYIREVDQSEEEALRPVSETFTFTVKNTAAYIIAFVVGKTHEVDTVTYPMIRLASDPDDTYQPHTPLLGSQVVYKLAEPVTYDFKSEEITLFEGINNIWADTGSSEMEYYPNSSIGEEIGKLDKRITELEAVIEVFKEQINELRTLHDLESISYSNSSEPLSHSLKIDMVNEPTNVMDLVDDLSVKGYFKSDLTIEDSAKADLTIENNVGGEIV